MKYLKNTLFVMQPEAYLGLEGGNVVAYIDHEAKKKVPLLNFQDIITFGRAGASPALINECLTNQIGITFMSPTGQFMGRVTGAKNGNVLLRKKQFTIAEDPQAAFEIAKNIILAKVFNQRWCLERTIRDHSLSVNVEAIKQVITYLKTTLVTIQEATSFEILLGLEGNAAQAYFSVFNEMILQQNKDFNFAGRSRRPPLDRVNALMSFAYTLLAQECASAAEAAGLDTYVGFLHQDRPGRTSLGLDLMEELRSVYADRFVLKMINKRMLLKKSFKIQENKAVSLTDEGRKIFISAWQNRKKEKITHPFLDEKMMWGQVPLTQAMLLARYLRGDLDGYPAFLWK
ncbi:MAG: type I-C CRISPR-associated endonuclease Cas1c [Lactobacillus sp.]|jgi:CRISPR-associated protein Cas1|nr:type I-C CRISPR-associated endonuclease Cas1c [Lactobacillus sp.]